MLTNRVPFIFPNFKNLRFLLPYTMVGQIFLNKSFFFFYILSDFFSQKFYLNLRAFNRFYLKSFSVHWLRVSFRGKGYRLRKFKATSKLTFNFGHSHWAKLLLSENFFFRKVKRQNYICLITHYANTQIFKNYIKKIKKINLYTKRGLRLKKQFIKKRFGKISQVVSSLH